MLVTAINIRQNCRGMATLSRELNLWYLCYFAKGGNMLKKIWRTSILQKEEWAPGGFKIIVKSGVLY